jgi:hypothetical protein
VDTNSVLIKYTYTGDTDFDGVVDADDYARIDAGYAARATGYRNGDLNYSGVIDADDYFEIDRAFGTQGAALSAPVSAPAASTGTEPIVEPEPEPEPTPAPAPLTPPEPVTAVTDPVAEAKKTKQTKAAKHHRREKTYELLSAKPVKAPAKPKPRLSFAAQLLQRGRRW